MVKNLPVNAGDSGLIPGLGRSPGVGNGNPTVFLPGKSHGQRSQADYSPWGHKELNMTEQLSTHSTNIFIGSLFTQINVQNYVLNK